MCGPHAFKLSLILLYLSRPNVSLPQFISSIIPTVIHLSKEKKNINSSSFKPQQLPFVCRPKASVGCEINSIFILPFRSTHLCHSFSKIVNSYYKLHFRPPRWVLHLKPRHRHRWVFNFPITLFHIPLSIFWCSLLMFQSVTVAGARRHQRTYYFLLRLKLGTSTCRDEICKGKRWYKVLAANIKSFVVFFTVFWIYLFVYLKKHTINLSITKSHFLSRKKKSHIYVNV